MILRRRRQIVVWTSSGGSADRPLARRTSRPARMRRLRWWTRVGVLLATIGLARLAGRARTRWPTMLVLAGALVTVAGILLPNAAVLVPGMLVFLAGVLSPADHDTVTEAARRLDAALVHRR
jgi:hypothetical protein